MSIFSFVGAFLQYCLFIHPKQNGKKVFGRNFYIIIINIIIISSTFVFITELAFIRLKFFYHPVVSQTHFLYRDERTINSNLYVIIIICVRLILMLRNSSFVRFRPWYFQIDLQICFAKNLMTQIVLCFNTLQRSCSNIYCNLLDQPNRLWNYVISR